MKGLINVVIFISGFLLTFLGRNLDSGIVILLGIILMISPAFLFILIKDKIIQKNEGDTKHLVGLKLAQLNFTDDKLLIANDLNTAIALNKENKNVLLLSRNRLDEDFQYKIVNFEDIIEVRIKRNSETLTTTSRGSQLAGAAIGGLAFGGIGSLIGAMGASKTSTDLTKRLSLEIAINDFDYPLFEVVYINMQNGLSESDILFKDLTKDLDNWYRIFTIVLHQNKLNIANM